VLQAQSRLSERNCAASVKILLKVCGHVTESNVITRCRNWLQARSRLLSTRDLSRIKQLLKECGQLEPCYVLRSIRQVLECEANLKDCFSEESLRVGIAIVSARITGSQALLNAMQRYAKFQRCLPTVCSLPLAVPCAYTSALTSLAGTLVRL